MTQWSTHRLAICPAVDFTAGVGVVSFQFLSVIMIANWFCFFSAAVPVCQWPQTLEVLPVGRTEFHVDLLPMQSVACMIDIIKLSWKRCFSYASSNISGELCRTSFSLWGHQRVSGNVPSSLSTCLVKSKEPVVSAHQLTIANLRRACGRAGIAISDMRRWLFCCIADQSSVQPRISPTLEIFLSFVAVFALRYVHFLNSLPRIQLTVCTLTHFCWLRGDLLKWCIQLFCDFDICPCGFRIRRGIF